AVGFAPDNEFLHLKGDWRRKSCFSSYFSLAKDFDFISYTCFLPLDESKSVFGSVDILWNSVYQPFNSPVAPG
ncbi:hypothetical protein CEXT_66691, partial [Caerostris extrusa]